MHSEPDRPNAVVQDWRTKLGKDPQGRADSTAFAQREQQALFDKYVKDLALQIEQDFKTLMDQVRMISRPSGAVKGGWWHISALSSLTLYNFRSSCCHDVLAAWMLGRKVYSMSRSATLWLVVWHLAPWLSSCIGKAQCTCTQLAAIQTLQGVVVECAPCSSEVNRGAASSYHIPLHEGILSITAACPEGLRVNGYI